MEVFSLTCSRSIEQDHVPPCTVIGWETMPITKSFDQCIICSDLFIDIERAFDNVNRVFERDRKGIPKKVTTIF